MNLVVRRGLVTAGVLGSLALGLVTIRAAAAWTAASAPLPPPPISADQLQSRLADEQARSATLSHELDQLRAQTDQVGTALAAARSRISVDDSTATKLRSQLAAAQAKIAAIMAARATSGGTIVRTVVVTQSVPAAPAAAPPAATPTPTSGGGEPGDH